MIIEISVGAVSLAIIILIIYLITTLRNVSKTLVQVRQTTNVLESDVHDVLTNANGLISETRTTITQVKSKTEKTDALFQAIDQISKRVSEVSASVSKVAEKHTEKLGSLLAVVGSTINLVQEWRLANNKKGSDVHE